MRAARASLTWLEYKERCDLSTAEGTAEFVKDIGAMMILGGYLVVGASDGGVPVGLADKQATGFVPAILGLPARSPSK